MSSTDIFGYTCFFLALIFWLASYLGIIWRGFKDRSYGMPLVALGTNISWECVFSFVYPPMPALAKYGVRAWFFWIFQLPCSAFYTLEMNSNTHLPRNTLTLFSQRQWAFVLPLSWGSLESLKTLGEYTAPSAAIC